MTVRDRKKDIDRLVKLCGMLGSDSEAVFIDAATYYRHGVTEKRPRPWFEPDSCPNFHLVDWMFKNGLVHDVWLPREPEIHDVVPIDRPPEDHPSEQQVRTYLASGRALQSVSDG